LHGRAAAHDAAKGILVLELGVELGVLLPQFQVFAGPGDQQAQMLQIDRFGDKAVGVEVI